jgi:N-acetylated-alpha-linked acidic dipeptidase
LLTISVGGWFNLNTTLTELENLLFDQISTKAPKAILERFRTLVRESGSEDETIAFQYLENYLKEWGVPHTVHYPELYLSVPKKASLSVISPVEKEIRTKTPSFSVSTGSDWVEDELIYIPTGYAKGIDDLFGGKMIVDPEAFKGKVIITEGYPMPGKVRQFSELGASGTIFISPGENIHEGICTSIWGAPDLDNINDEPKIPVLAVNKPDGQELIKLCQEGGVQIKFQTELEKDWFSCPIIDIFIEGTEEPEKYVFLHGHLDSWHVGIGDNATGDAALMEIARIFNENKNQLKRSLRIAIWSGHSTGRYAGSTWFADSFALDIEENCIAQVNCDSPGCRWATSYEYMMWMSETDEFCKQAIQDAVGQKGAGARPLRAGDYSFNNIGVTSFFMLSSSMPKELLEEKGYYPVGGCGANIEWHTEDDLLDISDLDVLVKDIKVYITAVLRAINTPIHPFNFVNTVQEFFGTIQSYQDKAGEHFNFTSALDEAEALRQDLSQFYERIKSLADNPISYIEVKEANEKIRGLARILVPINFSQKGKFRHDPALDVLPLPDIAPATEFTDLEAGSHRYKVLQTHLTRGQNRLIWALREARKLIQA